MKKKTRFCWLMPVVAAAVLAVVLLHGRESVDLRRTHGGVMVASSDIPTGGASMASAASTSAVTVAEAPLSPRGTKTVRITANRTMNEELRRVLAGFGARVIAPVGPRAVLVEATASASRKIAADSRFETEDVLPAAKVQGVLSRKCAEKDAETIPVTVVGLSAEDRGALSKFIVAQGGSLADGPAVPEIVYADVPVCLVASLAERGDVRWLEYHPPMKLLNDCSVGPTAANVASVRSKHLLRGSGQTVCVYDSGFDTGDKNNCHLDFAGRVKEIVNEMYTKADYMGHGTHCAGTVLGDGARSGGLYQGAAPEAMLFMQSAGDKNGSSTIYTPGTYEHIFASCLSRDAYIQSDSWGGGEYGAYDSFCSGLDQVAWDHPELLIVVAAGNDGYDGMGTVSSPACAKNALTVGNGYSTRNGDPENLNSSSSRGPTEDHRIKPDIAAPGTYKYSTLSSKSIWCSPISSNRYYTEMTGTSMATPLVAGSAALVRQWLQERRDYAAKNGGQEPTASLVKAILTGGGTVMTGACSSTPLPQTLPNNYVGWGRLNLEETLYPSKGRAVKFADRIAVGDGETWTMDVTTTNSAALDVQLCWTDYPADVSAEQTIINDLDLVVSNKTTGAVWSGNGVEGGDHTNTVESVRISTAEAGEYAVLVRGASISYAGGAAAVYVRGAFEDETAPDPGYVRIVGRSPLYVTLEDAIAEAGNGDAIEILLPVELTASTIITNSITIFATNENAAASMVTRVDDASLTVANGATLTLSNVVFSASEQTAVEVLEGGCLKLGERVDLGVDLAAGVAIRTADAKGFVLAGAPTSSIRFQCAAAPKENDVFGSYVCAEERASEFALKLCCSTDVDMHGFANGGKLSWRVSMVPVEDAAGYYVTTNGTETVTNAYSSLNRVFSQFAIYASSALPRIVVRRSDAMTNEVQVSSNVEIAGEDGVVVSPSSTVSFRIGEGGALTLTNITFRGYCDANNEDDHGFISVEGGALTLANGAMLDSMTGQVCWASGVIDLRTGSVTMKSGAAIVNCQAAGVSGRGGAVYASYDNGGILNLEGGVISNCFAKSFGGGVYLDDWYGDSAVVNISGDPVVKGNWSDNSAKDDVCLHTTGALPNFRVTGALDGTNSVGVRISTVVGSETDVNGEGKAFATNATESAFSPKFFFNDTDDALTGAFGENGMLVWEADPTEIDDGQCDESVASAHVYYPEGGEPRHYTNLVVALAYMTNGTTARIEMRRGAKDNPNTQLPKYDTIVSDAALPPDSQVTLTAGEDGYRVRRSRSACIAVPAGATLVITNLALNRRSGNAGAVTNAFIVVEGGALTLANGASVSGIVGTDSRDAAAITVYESGVFTMLDGAEIAGCTNLCAGAEESGNKKSEWGAGGGLHLDNATAHLKGGRISACVAAYGGGGVFACNGSTIYMDGDVQIAGNADGEGVANNLELADTSSINLVGEMTGSVLETPKRITPSDLSETNVAAKVDASWAWEYDALTNTAARFVNDITSDRGVPATNSTDAADTLILWGSAVQNGVYTNGSGVVYVQIAAAPSPVDPEPVYALPVSIAFKSITCNGGEVTLVITNAVQWCNYSIFGTNSLVGGFVITNELGEIVAEPVTNFQWKSAGQEIEVVLPVGNERRFWKATAEKGVKAE